MSQMDTPATPSRISIPKPIANDRRLVVVLIIVAALLIIAALSYFFVWPLVMPGQPGPSSAQQPELSANQLVELTTAPVESSLQEFSDETLKLIQAMTAPVPR